MPPIVHNAGQQILASTRHGLNSLLGGLVLARARSERSLLILRREAGRREGRLLVGMRGMPWAVVVVASGSTKGPLGEDIRDGWQSIVRLGCGDMVDVRCL